MTEYKIKLRKKIIEDLNAQSALFSESEKAPLSVLIEKMMKANADAEEANRIKPEEESEFWDIIHECNWSSDFNYKRIKEHLISKYTAKFMNRFSHWVDGKFNALGKAIDRFEKANGKGTLPYSGDDGWSDLLHHVIGNGKEYYETAISDPSILRQLKVEESFSYAIPFWTDYEKKV